MFRCTFMLCMINVMVVLMGVEATAQSKPEDIQCSFLRYKGASAKLLQERVEVVETPYTLAGRKQRCTADSLPGARNLPYG